MLFVCVLHMVSLCVATNSFPFQIMPPSSSTKKEAMEDRPTKLAKLSHLRKSVPYMSKSSLEQVLKFVKEEGVPELHSRKNMQEANQALTKQKTSSGPLLIDFDLVTLDGQTMPVQCTNLCTFLQLVYKQGGPWYQLLSKTMAQCQQKLHLVVYADEVTSGNVLAPITARKVWAIYASIKEFSHPSAKCRCLGDTLHSQVFHHCQCRWPLEPIAESNFEPLVQYLLSSSPRTPVRRATRHQCCQSIHQSVLAPWLFHHGWSCP